MKELVLTGAAVGKLYEQCSFWRSEYASDYGNRFWFSLLTGILMIPKTCAYVWTVGIGFQALRKNDPGKAVEQTCTLQSDGRNAEKATDF